MRKKLEFLNKPDVSQVRVFVDFFSKDYNVLEICEHKQLEHLTSYKIDAIPDVSAEKIKMVLPYLHLSSKGVRSFFLKFTHKEIRQVFNLGNSPKLNQKISNIKEICLKNNYEGLITLAFFILATFQNKKSETISYYLELLVSRVRFLEEKELEFEALRYELREIIPSHVNEVKAALNLVNDQKLQKTCPRTYEVLITTLTNCLSDVGRLYLDRGKDVVQVNKFEDIQQLAYKYNRRWLLEFGLKESLEFPEWFLSLQNMEIDGLTVRIPETTEEMYSWSVLMENCLHSYVYGTLKKEENHYFFTLKTKDNEIKYLVQVINNGTICEIKGKYNESLGKLERFSIQNQIYKKLNQYYEKIKSQDSASE